VSTSKLSKAELKQRDQRILEVARANPGWGQKTIAPMLKKDYPSISPDTVKNVISRARRRGELPAPKAKPKTKPAANEPAVPAAPEVAAGDAPEPATEAEVKRVAARYRTGGGFTNDNLWVEPDRGGWVIVVPLSEEDNDKPSGYRYYNAKLHCPTDEHLAACRRWLREAGVYGPIDGLPGREDSVPVERFPVHPAANRLDLLGDAELHELAEDIRTNKRLLDPITVYQGQLLDGRNRLAACDLAGVRPSTSGSTMRISATVARAAT